MEEELEEEVDEKAEEQTDALKYDCMFCEKVLR